LECAMKLAKVTPTWQISVDGDGDPRHKILRIVDLAKIGDKASFTKETGRPQMLLGSG